MAGDILGQMAGSAVGGGLAILGGALGNKAGRDAANQQLQHAKELTRFNRAEQMQLWKDTNYSAQVAELKKAGLSVGLMYGKGGGGGATANVATGGSAQQASTGNYDMGMAMQGAMMKAQIENIQADTELKKTDALKTGTVDTEKTKAETTSLIQGVENAKAQEYLLQADGVLKDMEIFEKGISQEDRMNEIKYDAQKAFHLVRQAKVAGDLDEATYNDKVKIVAQTAIGTELNNILTNAKIDLTTEQSREIREKINLMWEELTVKQNHNAIDSFKAEIQAAYPSIWQSAGGIIEGMINSYYSLWKTDARKSLRQKPNTK